MTKTNKNKTSPEIEAIDKALENYFNKYKGDVVINAFICGFDKKGNAIDTQLWEYGELELLQIDLEERLKQNIKDQKENLK